MFALICSGNVRTAAAAKPAQCSPVQTSTYRLIKSRGPHDHICHRDATQVLGSSESSRRRIPATDPGRAMLLGRRDRVIITRFTTWLSSRPGPTFDRSRYRPEPAQSECKVTAPPRTPKMDGGCQWSQDTARTRPAGRLGPLGCLPWPGPPARGDPALPQHGRRVTGRPGPGGPEVPAVGSEPVTRQPSSRCETVTRQLTRRDRVDRPCGARAVVSYW